MLKARLLVAVLVLSPSLLFGQEIPNWSAPPFWKPEHAMDGSKRPDLAPEDAESVEGLPTPALPFFAITPCRLADTRGNGFTGAYGPPALVANATRDFDLDSAAHCPGVPAGAQAYSLNVTVTQTQGFGDIRIWPTGSFALVSTQNWTAAGVTLANAAIVPAGTNGSITVQAAGSGTHLIIDINGYYAGGVVTQLNNLSGAVTLAPGSNVTITPSGQSLTIAATGGPGGNLPTGTVNQTLRHNGTSWVASNALSNNEALVQLTVPLSLPASGQILAGGSSFIHKRGFANAFLGGEAGNSATPGDFNTGVGAFALSVTTTGSQDNVAVGYLALPDNTTGDANIAIGPVALGDVNTGSGNIAIGSTAYGLTSGSNNLYIGNPGSGGNESGQIRIGTNGVHTQGTVIASISGFLASGGAPVYITGGGRLGTVTASSVRYKDDVRDVGADSDRLMNLHPVAFRYKPEYDPAGAPQFGLIAEEVAEIYPDLVECDSGGRPQGVRYHLLAPLLLNELQKERRAIDAQRAELDELKAKLTRLESLMREEKD